MKSLLELCDFFLKQVIRGEDLLALRLLLDFKLALFLLKLAKLILEFCDLLLKFAFSQVRLSALGLGLVKEGGGAVELVRESGYYSLSLFDRLGFVLKLLFVFVFYLLELLSEIAFKLHLLVGELVISHLVFLNLHADALKFLLQP